MRLPDLSTQQPTLVIGEPGCPISLASPPAPAGRFSRPRSAHCGPAARDGSAPTSSTACGSACCLASVIGISKVVRVANWIMALPQSKRKPILCWQTSWSAALIRRDLPSWLRRDTSRVIWRGVRETETTMETSIMRRVSATARYCVANFWRSSRTKPYLCITRDIRP